MQHERRDLEQLFSPPPNQFGTHMLICGLSADIETLERMMSSFTYTSEVERAAQGLVRAVLMLDASAAPLSPLAVPGLLRLAQCSEERWRPQTALMHAKVALLGFAEAPFAAPTAFRLIVSTGNWTSATWGNGAQIDLFWSADYQVNATQPDAVARADMAAALRFFDQLMQSLYAPSANFLHTQTLAFGWLAQWRAQLGQKSASATPRFVHSLDKSLFTQIKQAYPKQGVSTMVAGSGFWEQPGANAALKPEVLQQLDTLKVKGKRYLVANPKQAGALAHWVLAQPRTPRNSQLGGWTFCMPRDPLQKKANAGRTFLHAKYIAGLSRVATQQDKGTLTFLYLGSGNLSHAGLLSKAALGNSTARRTVGNVEAGVIMTGKQEVTQVWQALACGELLPNELVTSMDAGTGDEILKPRNPPPVLFARAVQQQLSLVRSTDAPCALEVRLDAVGAWLPLGATEDTVALPNSVPPVIWVRVPLAAADVAVEVYEVAVFSEDGACCRQAPNELKADDVLQALLAFPGPAPTPPDPDPVQPTGYESRPISKTARKYPLKLMAALIEAIGQRNATLTQEQFPVWLSQLRCLFLEQIAPADRDAIRQTGVNLFPALGQAGFAPLWLDQVPHLADAYRQLVRDIETLWALPSAGSAKARSIHGETIEKTS